MRCTCCNKVLNDYEATLRHAETGEFLDTCLKCLDGLGIKTKGRPDLNKREVPEDDEADLSEFRAFFRALGEEE